MQITAISPDQSDFQNRLEHGPAHGPRLRVRARSQHRQQRTEVGRGSIAEAHGEACRCRPLRSRSASVASLAHDPRVDRASHGARPRTRLRGQLRRHELRRAAGEDARQAQVRTRVHEHPGRPLAARRVRDDRLRRRRREARRVPDHQERHCERLPDDARAGELAQVVVRLAGPSDTLARLLQRRFVERRAVPAHAERVAASGQKDIELGRSHRARPIAASRSSATARSRSTSSATTRSSAASSSTRSRAARSSACSRTSRTRCARPTSGTRWT